MIFAYVKASILGFFLWAVFASCNADELISPEVSEYETVQETLYWAVLPVEPLFLETGEGIGDLVYNFIQNKLPTFRHINVKMTFSRLRGQYPRKMEFCSISLLTDRREQSRLYSQPLFSAPGPKLFISDQGMKKIGDLVTGDKAVDIETIFAVDRTIRLAIMKNRSYGAYLDHFLSDGVGREIIRWNHGVPGGSVKKLAANRVDAVIESSLVMRYGRVVTGIGDGVTAFDIAGVEKNEELYIACPKSDSGRRTIAKINLHRKEIGRLGHSEVERWMSFGHR